MELLRVSVLQPIAQIMLADRVFAHHIRDMLKTDQARSWAALGSILALAARAQSVLNSDSKQNRSGLGPPHTSAQQ